MAKLTFEPAPPKTLSVVVVADHRTSGELIESGLPNGQYAAFYGEDLEALIDHAQEVVRSWSFSSGINSRVDGKPYRLLVGELTGVVKPIREYEVEPL